MTTGGCNFYRTEVLWIRMTQARSSASTRAGDFSYPEAFENETREFVEKLVILAQDILSLDWG
jgi:hypothetical protein